MLLLDISGRISPTIVEIYKAVSDCADQLGIAYLVVGASARDMVMESGFGVKAARRTTDIDFAIQVNCWEDYVRLKTELLSKGFRETPREERLMHENDYPIDIVPFGGIANKQGEITWPPKHEVAMTVLGFEEALGAALEVVIDAKTNLIIPVASLEGVVMLKFISWSERPTNIRNRDTADIVFIIVNYERANYVNEIIYDDIDLIERYQGNTREVAAHLLGGRVRLLAPAEALNLYMDAINPTSKKGIEFMTEATKSTNVNIEKLIDAFSNGFCGPDLRF